jgi:hypothetical protein
MDQHFYIPHVSNFDRTDRLAGCEERWGPGGREVDGRRVIIIGPQMMVLIQTQQETRGRWTSTLILHFCTNYAVWEWV